MFITLEGGEAAGKTTQAELLREWIEARGHEVVTTREPGGTRLGARLREILMHGGDEIGDIDPRSEALLYAADRAQHVAKIVRPALDRDAVVVQDRYIDSSLAYQGAGRVLDLGDIRRISEWASGGLWPTLTVLLDLDPRESAVRLRARGAAADRLEAEALEFHQAVRAGFLELVDADPDRFLVIDASLTIEEIHERILVGVAPLLAR